MPVTPVIALPAALSLAPFQASYHNKGKKSHKHRHTDLHRQTRSQLVTTKHPGVWFSAEQLLAGPPALGEHSANVVVLKVEWKRGRHKRQKGFELKHYGQLRLYSFTHASLSHVADIWAD